jgi:hypothetical protein
MKIIDENIKNILYNNSGKQKGRRGRK